MKRNFMKQRSLGLGCIVLLLFITCFFAGCEDSGSSDGTVTQTLTDPTSGDSGSASDDTGSDGDDTGSPASGSLTTALPGDAKVIYLHHSTGGVIWNGGVSSLLSTYNGNNGTAYAITERAYPNSPYPWDNYPYDYWNIWINNAGNSAYNGQDTLEILTQSYDVIVFKHCFPVSGISADTGSPDISSSAKRIENYQLQYAALKEKMHDFTNTRFIVWTGAALVAGATNPDQAARARQFFTWVKNTWDEPGDNIYVWDFFELETEGGNYLKAEYAASSGDSHPNSTFAGMVAPYFVQRLVDVIEGRGDTSALTGQRQP